MRIKLFCIITTISIAGFTWACGHTPSKKSEWTFKEYEKDKTVESLKDALRINPNDIDSRIKLSLIFLSQGMIADAIYQSESALSINPKHVKAHLVLSKALQKRPYPDFLRVAALLENARRLAPENADVHLHLGQTYSTMKKDSQAIEELYKVISLSRNPNILVSARLELLAIFSRRGEWEKAKKEFEAVSELRPDIAEYIKQAEIYKTTSGSQYSGGEGGPHPSFKERIEKVQEKLIQISDEKK